MRKPSLVVLLLSLSLGSSLAAVAAPPRAASWPSADQQLKRARVEPGSALEKLILNNQDFGMLRAAEANDRIPVPLWLRVYWRKGHPEATYSAADPTGGYPHVLKEVAEWMQLHQELVPTEADEWRAPGFDAADADADAEAKALTGKTTVSPNGRVSGAQTVPRSEADIRINFWNPLKVVAASNNIGGTGQQAQYYSSDGGATWGQSFLPLTSTDAFHSDPAVDWTSDGTAWSATIGIKGNALHMRAYKSIDGGATWTFDNTFSGTQKNTDKELIWIDHSATSPFKDTIYACWHNGNPGYVNRRTGPAGSWGTPIQVTGSESTGTAIGCSLWSNANGDAFVFWPATGNSRIVMAKSTNGGTSWGTPKVVATTKDSYDIGVPAMASRRALIYVSGAAYSSGTVNNVYASWVDLTGATGCTAPANEPGTNLSSTCKSRVWFARSTDGGTTWSAPVMTNDQSTLNDQFNQWLGVDPTTGRIALIYYDTAGGTSRKKTDIYYQTSADNGATWSAATKLTTTQTDETVAGSDSGNQYGDYNSLSIYASKIFPIWTDRRGAGKEEIWTVPVAEP